MIGNYKAPRGRRAFYGNDNSAALQKPAAPFVQGIFAWPVCPPDQKAEQRFSYAGYDAGCYSGASVQHAEILPGKAAWPIGSHRNNRLRIVGERLFKSIRVRKSIVLNWRSSAGGPQIFAPRLRYVRSSLGGCTSSSVSTRGRAKAAVGTVRYSCGASSAFSLRYMAEPRRGSC